MSIARKDFPFFNQVHKNELVFFDSAASSQKPQMVIDKIAQLYSYGYANIHRGIYDLSAKLTAEFEGVRGKVAKFINAVSEKEIVFTKNATEAINLVAHSYGKDFISEGDEIVISAMEHHSNLVPWQVLCNEKKAILKIIPVTDNGRIELNELEKILSTRTKFIAITHTSNVFGTKIDVKEISKIAKRIGAKLLVDACQSIVHQIIDVQDLDCDFLVFSSHKLYGPSGVGVLYGRSDLLNNMRPYQTGGSMIKNVSFDKTSFLDAPHKFEAGTPAIIEVIGFGEAISYMEEIDQEAVWRNEKEIAKHIRQGINGLGGFKIFGDDEEATIISITHAKAHHSDIGDVLNQCGVAIRTGHHCAEPLMKHLGIKGTARISLGIYNNFEDAEHLLQALKKVNELF
jgi:cysteine desulfurase/selenocysteine lyase